MGSREAQVNEALGSSLQWLVSDRIIVEWENQQTGDSRFLGRLSSHNRKAEISLMLGHPATAKHELLLLLHLPLRVHAKSTSKPRDLFFVLPIQAFNTTGAEPPLSAKIAPTTELSDSTLTAITAAGLGNVESVLHISFNLTKPGYVVMPRGKVKKSVVGTPRDLLLSLRSLSQAVRFEGYLKRNTYSQVALTNFGMSVLQRTAVMPALRLKPMYQGRGAKQDAWDLFELKSDETVKRNINPLAGVEATESEPPPPYEEVVHTPTPQPDKPEEPQTPVVQVRDSVSMISETPPPEKTSGPDGPGIEQTRKRAMADAQSAAELGEDVAVEARKRRSKGPVIQPSLCERAQTPVNDEPRSLSDKVTYSSHNAQDLYTLQPDTKAEDLLCDIATWLQIAWSIDQCAHEKLEPLLLALGYYARQCLLRDFDTAKGWCTSLLYVRLAGEPTSAAVAQLDVEEDIAHLVAWANRIFRGAEQVLRKEMAALGTAARCGVADAYARQRALWVAHVFVCFGREGDALAIAERKLRI